MSDVVDLMLGVYRSPSRAAALRHRELPDDVIEAIRIVAGDADAVASAGLSTGLDSVELAEAATLLLHHLLFFDGADNYRVLGVRRNADSERIKQHYRWLVRWLHPDRDPDNVHSVFADRVNRAWNSLRNDTRRADYDNSMAAFAMPDTDPVVALDTGVLMRRWAEHTPPPLLSGRMVRRLPQIVVTFGALVALSLLGVAAWLRTHDAQNRAAPRYEFNQGPILAGDSSAPTRPATEAITRPESALSSASSSAAPPRAAETESLQRPALFPPARTDDTPAPAWNTVARLAPPATARPPAATSTRPDTILAGSSTATSLPTTPVAKPKSTARTTASTTASARAAPTALQDPDVAEFVVRFERLYAQNDLNQFLALFSTDAQGNGGGIREIADDYQRLFSQRSQRQLTLSAMHWQLSGNDAVGQGRYQAYVGASATKPESRSHGQILIGLRRDADGIRITQLHHSVSE